MRLRDETLMRLLEIVAAAGPLGLRCDEIAHRLWPKSSKPRGRLSSGAGAVLAAVAEHVEKSGSGPFARWRIRPEGRRRLAELTAQLFAAPVESPPEPWDHAPAPYYPATPAAPAYYAPPHDPALQRVAQLRVMCETVLAHAAAGRAVAPLDVTLARYGILICDERAAGAAPR